MMSKEYYKIFAIEERKIGNFSLFNCKNLVVFLAHEKSGMTHMVSDRCRPLFI